MVLRWIVLGGVYLVFAGTLSAAEGVAAALVSLGACVFACALRRASERRLAFRLTDFRPACMVMAELARDTVRVASALVGAIVGKAEQAGFVVEQDAPGNTNPAEEGEQSVAILAVSFTPASFVLRCAPGAGKMILHRLGGRSQ